MAAANTSSLGNDERLFLVIVVVLAVIAGLGSWVAATVLAHRDQLHRIAPDKPRQLIGFSLTDSTGATVNRRDLDGKILAVSFLFTGCALTCPEVSRHMAEIQRLTANQPDVRLLSFTVDPRTDTPATLAKWGARFGADTNRWFLLTGSKAALYDVIGTSFLPTDATDPFNSMPGNFTGTERIAVVDQHGQVRAYFDGLEAETPAAVVKEIDQLRKEN
jgi:cytochrome oxidase Cu insertion factor (SCO1/SenC/PrrC family)